MTTEQEQQQVVKEELLLLEQPKKIAVKPSSASRHLEQDAQYFLQQRNLQQGRCSSYKPTLEELKSVSFSDYVRSILFKKRNEDEERTIGSTTTTTTTEEEPSPAQEQPSTSTTTTTPANQQDQTSQLKMMVTRHQVKSPPPSTTTTTPPSSFSNKHLRWNNGMVKVTLPEGFHSSSSIDPSGRGETWQPNTPLGDLTITQPIEQHVAGIGGIYEYTLLERKPCKLWEFRDKADAYMKLQVGNTNSTTNMLTDDECDLLARKFWKRVGPTMKPAMYGADMEGSLFQQADCCGWNPEKLDSCLQLLCGGDAIPGVTTPYLYIGMFGAVFCAHTEDMNLLSINYLHAGAPKYWYAIAPEDAKRFESFAESHFSLARKECKEFLRHKRYMVSPAILKKAGIPYTTQIQRPGDAMITMPGGYHFGINLGFNVAEATNFAVPEWVPKGREANICMCRPHSVHIDMDGFEALLKRYNEDMLHAEKLGMRKKSYREWILLDTEGQNKQSLVSEGQGGGRMGMGGGGTKKTDPNLEKAKKNGRWFWVEVAKPAADGRQPSKKKQKRPMVQDDNDWRLAQPVSKIDMLKLGAKVLCLLRSKDAHGNEMDDELCFAGEIIELDEGCVKVHFEGMLRKEDAWINFNSEKVFLDTGHRYYTEEGLPNMNIKLPKDQSLELLGE